MILGIVVVFVISVCYASEYEPHQRTLASLSKMLNREIFDIQPVRGEKVVHMQMV